MVSGTYLYQRGSDLELRLTGVFTTVQPVSAFFQSPSPSHQTFTGECNLQIAGSTGECNPLRADLNSDWWINRWLSSGLCRFNWWVQSEDELSFLSWFWLRPLFKSWCFFLLSILDWFVTNFTKVGSCKYLMWVLFHLKASTTLLVTWSYVWCINLN